MSKSQEWLRQHYSTIGGSNAGAAAGRGRFTTRRELVEKMIAARAGEYIEPTPETDDMRRGRVLEPVALEMLNETRTEWNSFGCWDQNNFFAHYSMPWAHSLPDAYSVATAELVEIKVPRPQTCATVRRNGLFPEWIDQAQHGMAVVGWPIKCLLAILDPVTCQLDVHEIQRDNDYIAELMRLEQETWGYVIRGELPPEDESGVEPAEPGTICIADPRVVRLAEHYALMLRLRDEAVEVFEDAQRRLLEAVGCERKGKGDDAKWSGGPESFEVPGIIRVTHRNQDGAMRFNSALAKADFPALNDPKYTTQISASRPLRVRLLGRGE